jgi:hypothetical protein
VRNLIEVVAANSRRVCGIDDGSTNIDLREDRAIEELLNTIEPN